MKQEKSYQLNPQYVYSHAEFGIVKVISLEDADNKVFTIKGLSAEMFVKLVSGVSSEEIIEFVCTQDNHPPLQEIKIFLEKFIQDLSDLKFIEAK